MIKRFLVSATKEDKIENLIFFTRDAAETIQTTLISKGYKTKIIPLTIVVTQQEIIELYENEIEKINIFNDFAYILSNNYNVSENDDISKDLDIIYSMFKKVEDSDLSHWENIEKTIDYLKDIKNTNYDYNKIK